MMVFATLYPSCRPLREVVQTAYEDEDRYRITMVDSETDSDPDNDWKNIETSG